MINVLSSFFPRDAAELHNQTELSTISDEAFHATYSAPAFTRAQHICWILAPCIFLIVTFPLVVAVPCFPQVIPFGQFIGRSYIRNDLSFSAYVGFVLTVNLTVPPGCIIIIT
jgi:hypothetical protein